MSGCQLPDSTLIYDMSASRLTLYIPPVDPKAVIWAGLPVSPVEALGQYDVDEVYTTAELNAHLASARVSKACLYAIPEQVSGTTMFPEFGSKDYSLLREAIEECRVIKDAHEQGLIKHANAVSREAHMAVHKAAAHAQNEQELRGVFLERCNALGSQEQAYHGIFASGTNAATLHYVHNNQPLAGRQNILVDAACEKNCYAADITRTFPLSGVFTRESKAIYAIVLGMQKECIAMLKSGVLWEDVHLTAHRLAIQGLLDLGVLHHGTPDQILAARTSTGFFPHGLGHYLGMDTHDTGGHANYADPDPIFSYLRVRGTLPAGSVVTVEPGIYFCRFILEPMLTHPTHQKFINAAVLQKYWDVGGVRIEGT